MVNKIIYYYSCNVCVGVLVAPPTRQGSSVCLCFVYVFIQQNAYLSAVVRRVCFSSI